MQPDQTKLIEEEKPNKFDCTDDLEDALSSVQAMSNIQHQSISMMDDF